MHVVDLFTFDERLEDMLAGGYKFGLKEIKVKEDMWFETADCYVKFEFDTPDANTAYALVDAIKTFSSQWFKDVNDREQQTE